MLNNYCDLFYFVRIKLNEIIFTYENHHLDLSSVTSWKTVKSKTIKRGFGSVKIKH